MKKQMFAFGIILFSFLVLATVFFIPEQQELIKQEYSVSYLLGDFEKQPNSHGKIKIPEPEVIPLGVIISG